MMSHFIIIYFVLFGFYGEKSCSWRYFFLTYSMLGFVKIGLNACTIGGFAACVTGGFA